MPAPSNTNRRLVVSGPLHTALKKKAAGKTTIQKLIEPPLWKLVGGKPNEAGK